MCVEAEGTNWSDPYLSSPIGRCHHRSAFCRNQTQSRCFQPFFGGFRRPLKLVPGGRRQLNGCCKSVEVAQVRASSSAFASASWASSKPRCLNILQAINSPLWSLIIVAPPVNLISLNMDASILHFMNPDGGCSHLISSPVTHWRVMLWLGYCLSLNPLLQ